MTKRNDVTTTEMPTKRQSMWRELSREERNPSRNPAIGLKARNASFWGAETLRINDRSHKQPDLNQERQGILDVAIPHVEGGSIMLTLNASRIMPPRKMAQKNDHPGFTR